MSEAAAGTIDGDSPLPNVSMHDQYAHMETIDVVRNILGVVP